MGGVARRLQVPEGQNLFRLLDTVAGEDEGERG